MNKEPIVGGKHEGPECASCLHGIQWANGNERGHEKLKTFRLLDLIEGIPRNGDGKRESQEKCFLKCISSRIFLFGNE